LVLWSTRNLLEQRILQFPRTDLIWSSGPHEIYKSRIFYTFLLLIPFGPLVCTKFTRAENPTLSHYLSHLVFCSSQNLLEQRTLHFPSFDQIWSTGPHENYYSRECHTFLLFIPFGLLVAMKFKKSRDCFTSVLLNSFGPLVLTKLTRAVIATLSYSYNHIWSNGPHKNYYSREGHIFLPIIPFGPVVLTKFTRVENMPVSYHMAINHIWSYGPNKMN
jgi:hypothetical protein